MVKEGLVTAPIADAFEHLSTTDILADIATTPDRRGMSMLRGFRVAQSLAGEIQDQRVPRPASQPVSNITAKKLSKNPALRFFTKLKAGF